MIQISRSVMMGVTLAVLLALSGAVCAYVVNHPEEVITQGVKIHGIDIGGLTRQAAAVYLSGYFTELMVQPVEIIYGSDTWTLVPADCGVRVDIDAVLEQAVSVAKEGSFLARWRMRRKAHRYGVEIPLTLQINRTQLQKSLKAVAERIDRPAENAEFVINGDRVEVLPSRQGLKVDLARLEKDFLTASRSFLSRTVYVTTSPVPPELSTTQAMKMRITRKIASYVTEFDPEDEDRNHNIRLAAAALKKVMVAPGQVFSFNEVTGPRLASEGYRPAPVIIDGELLPGIGGGVCQVSSTLYNVVLLAGLSVKTRVPHSLPVKYVPLGQDATVAYDYIDFEFVNTLPYHILIDTTVTENRLEIAFFSTPVGDSVHRLRSQLVGLIEPGIKEVVDPSLPPGAKVEVRPGRPGYRVVVYRITLSPEGVEIGREKVSETVYPPRDRLVHIGSSRRGGLDGE